MPRFTYAQLLMFTYWYIETLNMNTALIKQNEEILEQSRVVLQTDEELVRLSKRLRDELIQLEWLVGQDWESFPIQ